MLGDPAQGDVDAVVVGSGPNGLAAAIVLAGAGLRVQVHEAAQTVGGGARTSELTLPGFRHDVCSAAHPMALASPFFRAFDLAAHGVRMAQPQVAYAHPLDGGRAGLAWRDLDRTAAGLGRDGTRWRRLFEPLVRDWPQVVGLAMSDLRHPPAHARPALQLATRLVPRRWKDDRAAALLAGVGSHAFASPGHPVSTGAALLLGTLAHAVGWPIPIGGSQAIADALAGELCARGGKIVLAHRVRSLAELPRAGAVLLDVAPAGLLEIAGDRLPTRYSWWLRHYRYGGGAAKVDFALSGPVPWAAPGCELAGTLHVIGSADELVAAERAVRAGKHPASPYVLAVQPGIADPARAGTLCAYTHVPNGSTVDVGEAVTAQIERFAPGFRDLILARHVTTAAGHDNPNLVGGDISGGALTPWQFVLRPVPRWNPYRTPIPGVYLCSSATPPGPAVHGMCGLHAAGHALRDVFGVRTHPLHLVRVENQRPAPTTRESHRDAGGSRS